MSRRAWVVALASLLFALNIALNLPLFRDGAQPYRGSIESGYAAMGRFFGSHPNPWGWNPYQYGGLPAQFTYLPGVPYLTAALLWIAPSLSALHAYRLVVATFACLGPVTLFLFVLYFTGSRWWALGAALAYTFFSPSYGLFQTIDKDRGILPVPWRLHVMMKYGEGPHNAGLTLLPLAIIAVWEAGSRGGFLRILLAAMALAAVTLTHWIASVALAFACTAMLLVRAPAEGLQPVRRTLAAGVLGYLLVCFWLTPAFIRTVAFNWPADAFNYKLQQSQWLLMGALAAGLVAVRALFGRQPERERICFLTLCFLGMAFLVEAYYGYGVDTIPESRRYALEFELFFFAALFAWFRLAVESRNRVNQFSAAAAAAVLLITGAPQAWSYVREGWTRFQLGPEANTVEYKAASWLAAQQPRGRVFASGGLRFHMNSWFDLQQVGGTFESGLRNRTPRDYDYMVRNGAGERAGREGLDSILQLKAMGVEYMAVHGTKSEEYYRDFKNPQRFAGLLETVRQSGDDIIYRVPFTSLAHVVWPSELPRWHYPYHLEGFVAALEDPARPKLTAEWQGTSAMTIGGDVPEGMLISVLANYDAGWRAEQDGRRIAVESDPLGFVVLRPGPATRSRVMLRYNGTREQKGMALVSGVSWIAALIAVVRSRRREAHA